MSAYWANRPAYNWDMLPYIALALLDAGTLPSKVHEITYASLDTVPAEARKELTEREGYRSHVARDAERFMDQLPLYWIKPVYPWLVSLLYRAGVQLPTATVVVSAASYALMLVLLFLWFCDLTAPAFAAALVACLAISPLLARVAALSTPDMLSVLVIVMALYLGIGRERHGLAAATLIFAILVRPENIIYAEGYFAYLVVARKWSLRPFALAGVAALALFFALTWISGYYGHRTSIYVTFIDYDIDVKHFVSPLGWNDYARIYAHGIGSLLLNPANDFGLFAALALGTLGIAAVHRSWSNKYVHLLALAGLCAAARYAVLPGDFYRAFVAPYTMVLIAFIAVCCRFAVATVRSPHERKREYF